MTRRWMTPWVRAIRHGGVVKDDVPGPDVDEFAEATEVVAALVGPRGGGDTLLAVQHPHPTPGALAEGFSLAAALPAARQALDRLRTSAYHQVDEVVAPYWVHGPDGVAVGVLCLVDPAAVDVHGISRVRHSEQVYPEVVAERAAVLTGLGCATSAAMLVPVVDGEQRTAGVLRSIDVLGAPAVSTTDSGSRSHWLWLLDPGAEQDAVLAAVVRSRCWSLMAITGWRPRRPVTGDR